MPTGASYTTPDDWSNASPLSSARFQTIAEDLQYLYLRNRPACQVSNAAVSVANVTITYLTFTTEAYDNDTIHSTTVGPSRLTATTAGVYDIFGDATYAASAGGAQRSLLFRLNGVTTIAQSDWAKTTVTQRINESFPYKLAAGDYVEMAAYHDSGAALNVTPQFGMTWQSTG